MTPSKMQSKYLTLFLIFVFAFAVRLFYISGFKYDIPVKDAAEYNEYAINMLHGKGFGRIVSLGHPIDEVFRAFRAPLYPMFLTFIYFFFGIDYHTVRIVQAFIGALTCVFAYLLTRRIFTERTALIAAFLFSIYRAFIVYNAALMAETLFMFFVIVSALMAFYSIEKPTKRNVIFCGIFCGLMLLTRLQGSGIFAGISVGILIFPKVNFRKKVEKILLLFLVTCLTLLPWVLRNYLIFHKFVPVSTQGGMQIGALNNPKQTTGLWELGDQNWRRLQWENRFLGEVERSNKLKKEGLEFIWGNPFKYINFIKNRFILFWGFSSIYWRSITHALLHFVVYILAAIGIIYSTRIEKIALFPLILILTYMIPVICVGNGDPRIRVPIEWLMLMYVGIPFNILWGKK